MPTADRIIKGYIDLLKDVTKMPDAPSVDPRYWRDVIVKPLDAMIDTLLPQGKEAVRLRYGLDTGTKLSYAKVGEKMHRTGSRVGQIIQGSLRKLAHPVRGRHFWLLYGIDKDFIPYDIGERRKSEITEIAIGDVPIEELQDSARNVMANYRRFFSESDDEATLQLYNEYHIGHDKFFENQWRIRHK